MQHDLIAIVDDDLLFRHILNVQIKNIKASKNVIFFENGQAAIDYFTSVQNDTTIPIPSIIFLDLNMPVMNGWEFLDAFTDIAEYIKEKVVIYIVTSSMVQEDQEKAKRYSEVSNYVVKPVTGHQLQKIIKEYKPNFS